ncbi:MAG: Dam family site-specific DNA-(adenine-N6)-methyltransferase [Candidatus Promineifilaceae bacterium]|nr:Dam family site-specific DNA-(adenine-N6)-methyltransferase [Candidatus Promineifilaceae bacterium]
MTVETAARPFLKWAGGKGRLLGQMARFLPEALLEGRVRRYVEPFVGGGAFFFFLQARFDVQEFYLFDRSPELVLVYRVVQRDVEALIAGLQRVEADYLSLENGEREQAFYAARASFNEARSGINFAQYGPRWIARAVQLIFLNRTCYNGLFRVNSRGDFNVPCGRYERPRICRTENLRAAARALQGVAIEQGDFADCEKLVGEETFVYFDPPYRPISRTAAFNAYARSSFGDAEQRRLAEFYRGLDRKKGWLMLSNSDPKNVDPEDDFFERAYEGFRMERIRAARAINSKGSRRGPVNELLILNY